jgi:hypothetical protein
MCCLLSLQAIDFVTPCCVVSGRLIRFISIKFKACGLRNLEIMLHLEALSKNLSLVSDP